MDGTLWSIVITFIIDVIIFVILVLLFLCLRKSRSRKPQGDDVDPHAPLLNESQLTLSQALSKVWHTTDQEMVQHCGLEGLLYFRLHRALAVLMSVLSVIGMVVLVTVYTQGSSATKEEVEKAGYSHVAEEEEMIIASFLCLVLFTGIETAVIYHFLRYATNIIASRQNSSNVVCIDGLPGDMAPEQLTPAVQKALMSLSPNSDIHVEIPRNWVKAYKFYKQLQPLRTRRRELEEYYAQNPEAPRKRVGCCKKTDELETCVRKESLLLAKLRTALAVNPKAVNSGTAFVSTGSSTAAAALASTIRSNRDIEISLKPKKWSVSLAKGPENVLWESQSPSGAGLAVKRVVYNVLFFLVTFVFLSPTGFLQYSKRIFGSVGGAGAEGFIGQYLPTILMFVYMDILLPALIELLVRLEQHRTNHGSRISAMVKYSLFFIIYLYVTPLIGFQVIELIDVLSSGDFGSLLDKMQSRFTKTGLYFFIFMIHAAFIKPGVLLLQPGIIISRKLKARSALVPRTKAEAYRTVEFKLPLDLTMSLLCVMMALSFAVIMPILLPITALFLIMKSAVQKYNLLCLTYMNDNTGGELVLGSLSTFLVCVLCFQWLTCFVLMITSFPSWLALGAIVAVSTLLQIAAFCIVRRRRRRAVGAQSEEGKGQQLFRLADFKHPMKDEFESAGLELEKVTTS